MALKSEFLITLLNLKGFGSKSVLRIAQQSHHIDCIDDLCHFWKTLKSKKETSVQEVDLIRAYEEARKIITQSTKEGIGILGYFDNDFPEILRNCTDEKGKLNPPLILYYRGNINALKMPSVAIIGTREPTSNGIKAGMYLSSKLSKKGYNIVSGLAKGCDTSGHKGALASGGITTAFLASDLIWDSIYPKENLELAKQIVQNKGLLLSEYHIGQSINKYGFVARDRLQAGLSIATIIIQTGIEGGSMHAANTTINSDKYLYAIDYKHEDDIKSDKVQGNIKLIKSGLAKPIKSTNISEIFEDLDNIRTSGQGYFSLF